MSEAAQTRALGLSYEGRALLLIAVLTALRVAVAGVVPLSFDEAYYWRWSTTLAWGYLDHPPLIAWLIRAGTALAGDTIFGIRLFPLLGGVVASWAVWRAAEMLWGDRRLAATAAVFFNLALILSVGTVLATPDAPLLVAAALLLYCLAKVETTGRARWWIAAGVLTGIGCLAKYTAFFWPPSIFLWLLLVPGARRHLRTPWPWAAVAMALVVFLPNFLWNASHDWLTFTMQFGRVDDGSGLTLRFFGEHLGAQLGMSTPVVFVLGWMALAVFLLGRGGPRSARLLLSMLVWPTTLYFLFHALHARVEGNWTGPIFPAFAIAAAAAVHAVDWRGTAGRLVRALAPLAIPVGIACVLAIYAQTLTGFLPLGAGDPTAANIGAGMAEVAEEVEAVRQREGAAVVLTQGYALTGWMSFYLPGRPPVTQLGEPERWMQEPPLDPALREEPALAVVPAGTPVAAMEEAWGSAERVGTVTRRRGDLEIAVYELYRLDPAE